MRATIRKIEMSVLTGFHSACIGRKIPPDRRSSCDAGEALAFRMGPAVAAWQDHP